MTASGYTLGKAESELYQGKHASASDLMDHFYLLEIAQALGSKTTEIISQKILELDLANAGVRARFGWMFSDHNDLIIYRREQMAPPKSRLEN